MSDKQSEQSLGEKSKLEGKRCTVNELPCFCSVNRVPCTVSHLFLIITYLLL